MGESGCAGCDDLAGRWRRWLLARILREKSPCPITNSGPIGRPAPARRRPDTLSAAPAMSDDPDPLDRPRHGADAPGLHTVKGWPDCRRGALVAALAPAAGAGDLLLRRRRGRPAAGRGADAAAAAQRPGDGVDRRDGQE